jgi:hypothetical protein
MTRYGIRGQDLRRLAVFGASMAFILATIFFATAYAYGTLARPGAASRILGGALGIGAIVPSFVALAGAISLRISDDTVEQWLLERWQLRSRPLSALTRITTRSGVAAVGLYFNGYSPIRLYALRLDQRHRLVEDLHHRTGIRAGTGRGSTTSGRDKGSLAP